MTKNIIFILAFIIFVCAAERLRTTLNKSKTGIYTWGLTQTQCVSPCQRLGGNSCLKATTNNNLSKIYHCCKGPCSPCAIEFNVSC